LNNYCFSMFRKYFLEILKIYYTPRAF
jgi:hypothetical protein